MGDEGKKECCSSGGCKCCCKGFMIGLLAGVILVSASLGIVMGTKCAMGGGMKMCPVSQMQAK